MAEKPLTFKKFTELIKSDNKKNNIVKLTIADKKIVSQLVKKLETKLDIFKDMPKLRTLIINQDGNDNIKTLPPTIFARLNHLTQLEFKSLWLNALPETIFQDLTELTSLSIEYNEFTSLPESLFKNNKKLKKLIIKNFTHTLGTLPENIFQGLDQLEELNLDANMLTSLPAGIFQGLPKLKDLNLNRNEFKTLPAGIFDGLTAKIQPESLKELVEEEDDEALSNDKNTCFDATGPYDKNIDKFLAKNASDNFILFFNGKKECESLDYLKRHYFSAELNDYEGYYECKQSVMDSQKQIGLTQTAFRKGDYYPDVEYVKVGLSNTFIVKPDWFYDGPVPEPRMFKLVSIGKKKPLLSKRIAKNYGTNVVSDIHCDPLDEKEIYQLEPVLNKASTPKQTAQQSKSRSRPSKSRPSKSRPSKSKSRRSRIYVLNRTRRHSTRRHSTLRNTDSNDISVGGMRKPKQKKNTRKNYKIKRD